MKNNNNKYIKYYQQKFLQSLTDKIIIKHTNPKCINIRSSFNFYMFLGGNFFRNVTLLFIIINSFKKKIPKFR